MSRNEFQSYLDTVKNHPEWWRLNRHAREDAVRNDARAIADVEAKRRRRQKRPQGSGMLPADKPQDRAQRLPGLARELLTVMYGWLPQRFADAGALLMHLRVDGVHPQAAREGDIVDAASLAEHQRRVAVTRAWLEELLKESVDIDANFFDVAERWEAKGKPLSGPCVWRRPC